jgi:hypothetical protein
MPINDVAPTNKDDAPWNHHPDLPPHLDISINWAPFYASLPILRTATMLLLTRTLRVDVVQILLARPTTDN